MTKPAPGAGQLDDVVAAGVVSTTPFALGSLHFIDQGDEMLVPPRSPRRLLQGIQPFLGQLPNFGEFIIHKAPLIIGNGRDS